MNDWETELFVSFGLQAHFDGASACSDWSFSVKKWVYYTQHVQWSSCFADDTGVIELRYQQQSF